MRNTPGIALVVFVLISLMTLVACGGAVSTMHRSEAASARPVDTARKNMPVGAPGATVIPGIQTMPNWESCTVCAGANAQGPVASYNMAQNVPMPSLSGHAAQFNVGDMPWGAALWWKQVGGRDDVHHFVYSVDFFVADPASSQALEFDVNQNAQGNRYIFGTECSLKNGGIWHVWDYTRGWVPTNVACPMPVASAWNHLEWEFERTWDNKAHFVSVSLNGNKQMVDMYSPSYPEGGSGVDVAFQMDMDGLPHNYSAWLDNVTLSMWQ